MPIVIPNNKIPHNVHEVPHRSWFVGHPESPPRLLKSQGLTRSCQVGNKADVASDVIH